MFGKLTRALIAAAACAVAAPVAVAAGASPPALAVKVGPRQDFAGLVNAKTSNAVIHVLCPGPVNTGHPLAGQTAAVALVVDPITPNDGVTGTAATSIGAWLTWLATTAPPPPAYIATFTRYRTMPVPASITVPCSGSGQMLFLPAPGSPAVKAATVNLTFVNIGGQHPRQKLAARR
jgi:hypothetical protein